MVWVHFHLIELKSAPFGCKWVVWAIFVAMIKPSHLDAVLPSSRAPTLGALGLCLSAAWRWNRVTLLAPEAPRGLVKVKLVIWVCVTSVTHWEQTLARTYTRIEPDWRHRRYITIKHDMALVPQKSASGGGRKKRSGREQSGGRGDDTEEEAVVNVMSE